VGRGFATPPWNPTLGVRGQEIPSAWHFSRLLPPGLRVAHIMQPRGKSIFLKTNFMGEIMNIESLKKQHIFEFLTPEQIDALSNASEVIKLKAGEVIYKRGEQTKYFFIILGGKVAIRLPKNGSASILIDELTAGSMFGSCVSPALGAYFCTAQCAEESELLKIRTDTFKEILDKDCCMGYAIQSKISQIYFKRYMDTMKKLQSH
jgi:hypothetical protein